MRCRSPTLAALLLCLCLAPSSSCDAQVDSEFSGDPVATISGEAPVVEGELPAQTHIALGWLVTSGADSLITTRPEVGGRVPGAFVLLLRDPPPPQALNKYSSGPRFGVAYIALVSDEGSLASAEPPVVGGVTDYLVAYLEADAAADTEVAQRLGGAPLSAGYHLLRVEPPEYESWEACMAVHSADCPTPGPGEEPPDTDPCHDAASQHCQGSAFDRLVPARYGFETQLRLEIPESPASLDWPDWT